METKDIYKVTINYDDKDYTDRFSFAGLKIAHKKDKNEDSLGYILRDAMIKAVEKEIIKQGKLKSKEI